MKMMKMSATPKVMTTIMHHCQSTKGASVLLLVLQTGELITTMILFYALLNAVHGILLLPAKQTTGGVALEP